MKPLHKVPPPPPGWSADTPMETGVYEFLGWVEGRSTHKAHLPQRVSVCAVQGRWQHATYNGDFAFDPNRFHGVWRPLRLTEAEAAFQIRHAIWYGAHNLADYFDARVRWQVVFHAQQHLFPILNVPGDNLEAVLQGLVAAGVLAPHVSPEGEVYPEHWKVWSTDPDVIREKITLWATTKYGAAP